MHKIIFSKRAEEDLEEIWFYTFSQWAHSQADTYHDALFAACLRLAKDTNLGASVDEIRMGYRKYLVKRHIIFFTVSHIDKSIFIVRILHQSMDIEWHLGD